MFYLLDNSKNLTQPVGIGFLPPPVNKTGGEGGRGREAIYSIHDIRSENQCQTPKLDFFESCYSKPIRNGTMFCWLSKKTIHPDDKKIKILNIDWRAIHSIELKI